MSEEEFDPLDFFDEYAVFEDPYPEDADPKRGPDNIALYPQLDDRDGKLKTYGDETVEEYGPVNFGENRSGSTTVDRIVWLDGYRMSTGDGAAKKNLDPMTLVVIQLSFEVGITRFAGVELRFQSNKKGDPYPAVVAWGPFRHPETRDTIDVHHNYNYTGNANLTAGFAGQGATVGGGKEHGMEYNQPYYEQGSSKLLYSDFKSQPKPYGVRWTLTENPLFNRGISPEVRLGVLISRPQPLEEYKVTLRLVVHTSAASAFGKKALARMGLPPDKGVRWLSTPKPGNMDGCYGDGVRIVKTGIDIENLGALIRDPDDGTNLNPSWLKAWDRFDKPNPEATPDPTVNIPATPKPNIPTVEVSDLDKATANPHMQTTGATVSRQQLEIAATDQPEEVPKAPSNAPNAAINVPSAAAYADRRQPEDGAQGPIGVGSEPSLFRPPAGHDYQGYNRLVWLETRAAQAEARLAAQDILISKLQRDLARLELLVSAGGRVE